MCEGGDDVRGCYDPVLVVPNCLDLFEVFNFSSPLCFSKLPFFEFEITVFEITLLYQYDHIMQQDNAEITLFSFHCMTLPLPDD